LALAAATAGIPLAASPAVAAPVTVGSTTYSVGTPSVSTITDGTTQAPWNEAQGDPASPSYTSQAPGTLLPTYTPGGATTGTGVTAEPNLAVYPGANSGTDGDSPYPSGTVGTPGPLDGYCGTGNQTTESAGTPAKQPTSTTLPFAPAYFPHVIRNTDGSLTGYFDYRPKDADEALVAATSTDNGKDWTYDGEALEENPGYCPSADINDDGQGHANVITIGGNTYLYTLARAAGDMQGVGMIIHKFTPTETNPLAGLPATEKVGIDPDAFVPTGTTSVSVTHGTAQSIPLTSLGSAGSPEQLVVGSFVDETQTTGTPVVITCTGLGTSSLTGCTTASGSSITVNAGDLIEQVMGFTTPSSDVGLVIPAGPNTTNGDGGLSSFTIDSTSGNTGFADPLTGTTFNNNAPNRLYLNGKAIYCSQANANPTTHIEDCTTGPAASSLTITTGLEPITGDPIIPATAYNTASGDGITNGLVAPDGIVGVLPSYPGAPANSTIVMYTEKELNYYLAGETGASGTFSSTTGQTIAFTPGTYISQDMPASGPWTVQMGATSNVGGGSAATAIIPVTCTTLNKTSASLGGCTVPSAYSSWTYASNSYIGAPGATTLPQSTLNLTGEGKSSDISKLNKNNEDLTVLRVAYTTDGVNFLTSGLANGGVISGAGCETGTCSNGGAYDDISNPSTTANPLNASGQIDLNEYAAPGTLDATEMRWVGSAGTIVTNPNGTYGLFLSGAWAADGDSDSFNQIFYSESSDGEHWSVPQMVLSTDYTFAASAAQDTALAHGIDAPLGVSAYYEGRAYGPSVVQNLDGTLTMIFSGYRLPKTISNAGTQVGTDPNAQWTIGATDPALYRNILSVTLTPSNSAATSYPSQTTVTVSPSNPVAGQQVTYTATVGNPATGAGVPTGTVTFAGDAGTICPSVILDQGSPDTATCTTSYAGGAQSDQVTASYTGDTTFAGSTGSTSVTIGSALSLTKTAATTAYGAAGDIIDYSYGVTNTSPDALSSVSVSDSLIPSVSCPESTLASGTSETCTGSYTATQADVDAGSVTNTATASADDGSTGVTSAGASATVDASNATSSLSLTKSTSSTGYGKAGDVIDYSYVVTNTGTTTESDIAVDDNLVSSVSCPSSTLAPGVPETCTGSYTATQADVDAGSVTNSATASGTNPQGVGIGSNSSSVTVDASDATSSLSLTKSTTSTGYGAAGDTIDYEYVVTNTGTTTESDIAVSDNLVPSVICPSSTLAPGVPETCTGSYQVTQANVDAGSVTNTATASAIAPPDASAVTSNPSSVTVDASNATSSLSLTKSTPSTGYGKVGDTIAYKYVVTNTGTTTESGIAVDDNLISSVSCPSSTLAPGAPETCTATYTVSQANVDAGSVTNTATASGTNPYGVGIGSNTSSVTVDASDATSSLSIAKSTNSSGYGKAGDTIDYSYLVANTGTTDLSNVGVTDSLIPSVSCPHAALAPGGSETCTASYTVTQANVDSGSVTNSAYATATAPPSSTQVTSGSSSVTVDASNATSGLSMVKTTNSTGYGASGEIISYGYLVTNTGSTTESSVGVTDNLIPSVSCPHATLAGGASETCTASYTVTQANVNSGSVTNTATAHATNPHGVTVTSGSSSVTVLASQATAALALTEATTSTSFHAAGEVIHYTSKVTNIGTETLTGVHVTDNLISVVKCPTSTLAPAAAETCTSSLTVTQADVHAGSFTNAATASAADPHGASVTSASTSVRLTATGLRITNGSLPSGVKWTPGSLPSSVYVAQLNAAGGKAPYSFELAANSKPLPVGVHLYGTGTITGKPTAAGTYPITVEVVDSEAPHVTATAPFTIVITP
jgi:uncharacterized repeat protein (TIGR01451 family)